MGDERATNWSGMLAGLVILIVLGLIIGTRQIPITLPAAETNPAKQETTVLSTVSYTGEDGKNALELLQASHQAEVQQTDIGAFVIAIDGVGGQENAFWLYYVDGEPATMAADNYETKTGQTIEWRYEQF